MAETPEQRAARRAALEAKNAEQAQKLEELKQQLAARTPEQVAADEEATKAKTARSKRASRERLKEGKGAPRGPQAKTVAREEARAGQGAELDKVYERHTKAKAQRLKELGGAADSPDNTGTSAVPSSAKRRTDRKLMYRRHGIQVLPPDENNPDTDFKQINTPNVETGTSRLVTGLYTEEGKRSWRTLEGQVRRSHFLFGRKAGSASDADDAAEAYRAALAAGTYGKPYTTPGDPETGVPPSASDPAAQSPAYRLAAQVNKDVAHMMETVPSTVSLGRQKQVRAERTPSPTRLRFVPGNKNYDPRKPKSAENTPGEGSHWVEESIHPRTRGMVIRTTTTPRGAAEDFVPVAGATVTPPMTQSKAAHSGVKEVIRLPEDPFIEARMREASGGPKVSRTEMGGANVIKDARGKPKRFIDPAVLNARNARLREVQAEMDAEIRSRAGAETEVVSRGVENLPPTASLSPQFDDPSNIEDLRTNLTEKEQEEADVAHLDPQTRVAMTRSKNAQRRRAAKALGFDTATTTVEDSVASLKNDLAEQKEGTTRPSLETRRASSQATAAEVKRRKDSLTASPKMAEYTVNVFERDKVAAKQLKQRRKAEREKSVAFSEPVKRGEAVKAEAERREAAIPSSVRTRALSARARELADVDTSHVQGEGLFAEHTRKQLAANTQNLKEIEASHFTEDARAANVARRMSIRRSTEAAMKPTDIPGLQERVTAAYESPAVDARALAYGQPMGTPVEELRGPKPPRLPVMIGMGLGGDPVLSARAAGRRAAHFASVMPPSKDPKKPQGPIDPRDPDLAINPSRYPRTSGIPRRAATPAPAPSGPLMDTREVPLDQRMGPEAAAEAAAARRNAGREMTAEARTSAVAEATARATPGSPTAGARAGYKSVYNPKTGITRRYDPSGKEIK